MVTKTSQMLLLTSLAKARGKKEVKADGLAVRLIYKKIRANRGDPQSDGCCRPPHQTHCRADRMTVAIRRANRHASANARPCGGCVAATLCPPQPFHFNFF
jgi:hypothetical protein